MKLPNITKLLLLITLIDSCYINAQVVPLLKKNITSKEYKELKLQGKLVKGVEYNIKNGSIYKENSYGYRPASPNSYTPCDNLPTNVGSVGYSIETDDSPLLTIPIPFNFCFYGVNYTSLNLSANGNVQFSSNSTSFSSTGFPSTAVNMIAPFWADAESMVVNGGITYGKIFIDSHPTYMIITWDSMGYFNNHTDKINTFQLVLTNGLDPILPPGKNVGFYYKTMQWTTGDASGGTNGFPSTQPGTPATVGINQGNGVDYFLIGRFGVTGSIYDGPLGNSDGISWLNGKRFYFNVCPPTGSNIEPLSTLIGYCDTLKVCGNDTLIIKNAFIGPELTQSVSITASAPTLGGSFTYTTITTGNNTDVSMSVNGSSAPNGNHLVTMTATDNGTPPLISSQAFIVVVDHTIPNPLNANIVFSPTIGVCPGGSTTASIVVTGGTPISYLWNNSSSSTSSGYTITPALDSLVYVTIKDGHCQKTIKNYIHVNAVPVATITSANLLLCSGTNSTTVLTASNTLNFAQQAPYTYSWTGTTNPTSLNTQTTTASAGAYSVTITNKYNCTSSAAISVTLNTTPQFTVVPTNTTICSNSNVPLTINFGSAPPTSCGLSTTGCFSPNQIAVGNGATANTSTSSPAPYGNYDKNRREQYLFTAAELIAAGLVPGNISSISFPVNSIQPVNTTSVSGSSTYIGTLPNYSIKMKCTSATTLADFDNVGLTQVYFGNFTPVVGLNTHTLPQAYSWDGSSSILVDICYTRNLPLSSEYYTSNPITPYTNTGVTKTVYFSADGTPACGNANGTTSTNRPNIKFGNCSSSPNPNSFSYSWLPTTGLSNAAIQSPTTNVSSSIIYTVVVTPTAAVTCSNVGTTSLTITVPAMPIITPVTSMCSNASSFSLTGLPTGGTWSLTAATSTVGVFTPSLASIGNNTVTYTYGGLGCLQSTTAIVTVERFVPSTITGAINPLCVTNSAVNLSTSLTTSTLGVGAWAGNGVTGTIFDPAVAGVGTHTITYSTNSSPTTTLCPSTSSITISVSSLTQPTLTPAGPYCDNFAIQSMTVSPIVASGATWSSTTSPTAISSTGQFNPAAATLGSSTITYSVVNGPCTASTSINVNVVHFIPATITGTVGPFCIYNPLVNLQATAQYTGGVWSGSGVTGSDFTPALAGPGTHTVTYKTDPSPSGLCPDSMKLSILVNAKPQANALSNATKGCSPLQVNLYSSTVNTGNANWNFGDGSPLGNGLAISHTYSVPGVYTASISYTDAIGCVNDSSVANSFTVFANPVASFEPSLIQTTVVDGQIDFTNHSTILNNNTYSWDISGLSTSTQTNTSYLFTNSGHYVITLTATSADNCVDDTSIVVIINPDVVLYVPNAFTPGDGNGLNDMFQIFLPPTGVDYSTFSLQIFDRWGEMIYSTNDVTKSWNGAKNNVGPLLKQDTYVWKISFSDEKKKEYNRLGHVTILSK
jgi:gliding motility-associated-like protein